VRQAAEALQVSTSTVYALCASGKLAHFRVGNAIRIEPTAIAALAGEGAHPDDGG
jgi:excisionase family DNA binding protein